MDVLSSGPAATSSTRVAAYRVNQVDRSSATALETAARIVTVSLNSKPGVGYGDAPRAP
jgi:hypothetical protein